MGRVILLYDSELQYAHNLPRLAHYHFITGNDFLLHIRKNIDSLLCTHYIFDGL